MYGVDMYMLGFLSPSPDSSSANVSQLSEELGNLLTFAPFHGHFFQHKNIRVRKHLQNLDLSNGGDGKLRCNSQTGMHEECVVSILLLSHDA